MQPLLAMALPWLWWFSLSVLLGEMTSSASAANYQPRYYRRICYRPHCYHGYRGYHGYNVGHLSAGKCRRSRGGFKFPRFSQSARGKSLRILDFLFVLSLYDLPLHPFDFSPERQRNSCRCNKLNSEWLSMELFTVARVFDCASSQTGEGSV